MNEQWEMEMGSSAPCNSLQFNAPYDYFRCLWILLVSAVYTFSVGNCQWSVIPSFLHHRFYLHIIQ